MTDNSSIQHVDIVLLDAQVLKKSYCIDVLES